MRLASSSVRAALSYFLTSQNIALKRIEDDFQYWRRRHGCLSQQAAGCGERRSATRRALGRPWKNLVRQHGKLPDVCLLTCLPIITLPHPSRVICRHLTAGNAFTTERSLHRKDASAIPVGEAVPALHQLRPRFSPPEYRPAGSADCRAASRAPVVWQSRSNGPAR